MIRFQTTRLVFVGAMTLLLVLRCSTNPEVNPPETSLADQNPLDDSGPGDSRDTTESRAQEVLPDQTESRAQEVLPDQPDGTDDTRACLWGPHAGPGTIRVQFTSGSHYAFLTSFDYLTVSLRRGALSCKYFDPLKAWAAPVVQQKTLGSVDTEPIFDGLDRSESYVVTVVMVRTLEGSAHVVGSGCLAPITFPCGPFDSELDVDVPLEVLELYPDGSFDESVVLRLESEGFSSAVHSIVAELAEGLSESGLVLEQNLKNLVLTDVLPDVTPEAVAEFEVALSLAMGELLAESPLDFWGSGLVLEQEVSGILGSLELTGTLELEWCYGEFDCDCYDGSYECPYLGTEGLEELVLAWTWGCEVGDTECASLVLENTLVSKEFSDSLPNPSGMWCGSLEGYDRLLVGWHGLDVDVGGLVGLVVDRMVVPRVTGLESLEVLWSTWVDCTVLTGLVPLDVLAGVGLSTSQLAESCESVKSLTWEELEPALIVPLVIHYGVEGEALVVNQDSDKGVELITQGSWSGTSSIVPGTTGYPGLPLSAGFQAVLKD